MIDLDYSFIRFRRTLEDAKNLNESPQFEEELAKYTQVHLKPSETYVQITNCPIDIAFNDNYDVWLVDECGVELEEITERFFIWEFLDTNGRNQIVWEFLNNSEYNLKPIAIRLRSTILESNVFYSNLFVSTDYNSHLTSRFDYKDSNNHYGTQYNRADFYQSIRLNTYYRNKINESERSEYHQITTGVTVPQRNIKKIKERYLIQTVNTWTNERIENMLTNSEIYTDCIRTYSTTPIEFLEPEMDSNFAQGEMILNKDYYSDTFEVRYQIFDGIQLITKIPLGNYSISDYVNELQAGFNVPITIGTGNLTVHDANDDSILATYNESDLSLVNETTFTILDFEDLIDSIGEYYIKFDSGLIYFLDIPFEGIDNNTDWTFEISDGEYDEDEYDNDEYLTGGSGNQTDNLVLQFNFNETSGTTTEDSSQTGLDGTVVNALINQTGLIDKAYLFNDNGATDEYVDVPDNDILSFTDGTNDIPFSISLWVKPTNNFGAVLNKYNSTDGYEYRMFIQSGIIQFFIYSENGLTNRIGIADSGTFAEDAWNHVVVTWDGTNLNMKVNNVDASFAQSETGTYVKMSNTSSILRLGQESDNDSGSNRFVGNIDILKIWKDKVLTDAEITAEYNNGNGTEN